MPAKIRSILPNGARDAKRGKQRPTKDPAEISVPPHTVAAPADTPPVERIILVAATAALGGFLFGFDTAVINGALYVVFFGMSWGPVVWVLLGEMFNNRIRAHALAVAAAAQWVANSAFSQTLPALAATGLGLPYGIYATLAAQSLALSLRAACHRPRLQSRTAGARHVNGRPAHAG